MAADVAEGAERALLVADDDYGFANDIDGEECFGIGDGAFCGLLFAAFATLFTGCVESAD